MATNNTHRKASFPFDGSFAFSPDIILRTADHVSFHVHKAYLSLPSPVFSDMFAVPQPVEAHVQDRDPGSDLPVVTVAENSTCWDPLLRFLYPTEDPSWTMDIVLQVMIAAKKYEMPFVLTFSETWLSKQSSDDPVKLYVLACSYGLEKLAASAIQNCPTSILYIPEMNVISAGRLYRLLECITKKYVDVNGNPSRKKSKGSRDSPLTGLTIKPRESLEIPSFISVPASHPHPDAVLRSADHIEFRVNRAFLTFSSPTFAALLDGRSSDGINPLPTIDVEESAHTLHVLIQLCTPGPEPQVEGLHLTRDLLRASLKYGFPRAKALARRCWAREAFLDPYNAYFMARRLGWVMEAKTAAVASLLHGDPCYFPEMEELPARSLYDLLEFRSRFQPPMILSKLLHMRHTSNKWCILDSSPRCYCNTKELFENMTLAVSVLDSQHWRTQEAQSGLTLPVNPSDIEKILKQSRDLDAEIENALQSELYMFATS